MVPPGTRQQVPGVQQFVPALQASKVYSTSPSTCLICAGRTGCTLQDCFTAWASQVADYLLVYPALSHSMIQCGV